MEKFITLMAEILEVAPGELSGETVFREVGDFDSMKGFMMICSISDEYGKDVSVNEFLGCKTINDLYVKATAK